MKTAISIPDSLYKKVERAVKRMSVSRSRFFTLAVEEYLERHYPSQVTEKLNSVYDNKPSEIDVKLLQMQSGSIEKEEW